MTNENTFEISRKEGKNKKWRDYADRMRLWEEFLLATHQVKLDINYMIDMDAGKNKQANDKDSNVFLTKLLTDIFEIKSDSIVLPLDITTYQKSSPPNGKYKVSFNNIEIEFHPKNAGTFKAQGFKGDASNKALMGQKDYTDKVLLEKAKAAMILAHHAKLAGWTTVHFGDTKDPLDLHILQCACDSLGLKYDSEKIRPETLPQYSFYGDKIDQAAKGVVNRYQEQIRRSINFAEAAAPQKVTEPSTSPIQKTSVNDLNPDEIDALLTQAARGNPSPSPLLSV